MDQEKCIPVIAGLQNISALSRKNDTWEDEYLRKKMNHFRILIFT